MYVCIQGIRAAASVYTLLGLLLLFPNEEMLEPFEAQEKQARFEPPPRDSQTSLEEKSEDGATPGLAGCRVWGSGGSGFRIPCFQGE